VVSLSRRPPNAVEELTDEELKLAERSLAESEARMKGEQVVSPRLRWVS